MTGSYRVFTSGVATDSLDRALSAARERGIYRQAKAAARWLVSELAVTPMQNGESRGYFQHLQLYRRLAFARPVSVLYAVHEDSKTVFVLAFGLTGL